MDKEARIYSTENGAVFLKSSTKNDIIKLLMEGDKTSSDIQEKLNRAKSTVSVHLSDLKEIGLVKERVDPDDSRKKIFSLESKLLGSSDAPYTKQYKEILGNLKHANGDRYLFLKTMFHLIRYGLVSLGLDVHPALKEIGRDAGMGLAAEFHSDDLEGLLKEIGEFWESNGLGAVDVEGTKDIVVHGCFDCGGMPDVGQELCSLDEGLLEGIIQERLGITVNVKEKECSGTGEDHCRFEVSVR